MTRDRDSKLDPPELPTVIAGVEDEEHKRGIARRALAGLGRVIETAGDVVEDVTDRIGVALGAEPNDAPEGSSGPGGTGSTGGSGGTGSTGGSGGTGSTGGSGGTGSTGGSGGTGSTGGSGGTGSTGGTGGSGGTGGPPSSPTGGPRMSMPLPIKFRDIADREQAAVAERDAASKRRTVVPAMSIVGTTPTAPTSIASVDPLYRGVAAALGRLNYEVVDHKDGLFPSQQTTPPRPLTESELTLAAVFGILAADNVVKPERESFNLTLTGALAYYSEQQDLFHAVLPHLAREGETPAAYVVSNEQWATVVRLLEGRVSAGDPQLGTQVRAALANQVVASETALPSSIDISLPPLEAQIDVEIVADNIRATQAIHYAAMLEEWRFFQVADKLVELFQHGLLPLGRGRAGDLLYAYWKKSVNRITEYERRNIFARTFGMPGGDPNIQNPNRGYHDLFLRFVSAVSSYVRQQKVDAMLRSAVPMRISGEQVRKAGRDLAANLSLNGYGMAHFAATELQTQINDVLAILKDPEIRGAYGARDFSQVIDQVSALELGGARNGIRYRTMAHSGAVIIRWLAENPGRLSSGYGYDFLNVSAAGSVGSGAHALNNPSDDDLVEAAEAWLAVTGTPEDRVEEYSHSVEGPVQTSSPTRIPQFARDILESTGIAAAAGNGPTPRWR